MEAYLNVGGTLPLIYIKAYGDGGGGKGFHLFDVQVTNV